MMFRADIEQEVNGLYSNDRKEKVPAADVKAIMDEAINYYHKHVLVKTIKKELRCDMLN